jgi:hypothetical protein
MKLEVVKRLLVDLRSASKHHVTCFDSLHFSLDCQRYTFKIN